MQLILGAATLIALAGMLLFFPETSHPGARGIDKWRQQAAVGMRFKFVWVNPLSALWLLKSPNLLAVVSLFPTNPTSFYEVSMTYSLSLDPLLSSQIMASTFIYVGDPTEADCMCSNPDTAFGYIGT